MAERTPGLLSAAVAGKKKEKMHSYGENVSVVIAAIGVLVDIYERISSEPTSWAQFVHQAAQHCP